MAIIVPKFTDDRTLAQIHAQLMNDIESICSMLTWTGDDDHQTLSEVESMCEELSNLNEVTTLKWDVDCDCFYTGKDHQ